MTQSRLARFISGVLLFSAVFVGTWLVNVTWLLSAPANTQSITLLPGIYRMTGTAPVQPGEPAYTYTGAAEILASLQHPGIYDVRWVLDARPESNVAIGQGYEHNGVFVVIIAGADGAFTLASYAREGDKLTGVWMVPGETGLLTETLTRTTKATLQEALEPVVPGPARPEHAPQPRVNPAETYTIQDTTVSTIQDTTVSTIQDTTVFPARGITPVSRAGAGMTVALIPIMTIYVHFKTSGRSAVRMHNVESVKDNGIDSVTLKMLLTDAKHVCTDVSHVAVQPERD